MMKTMYKRGHQSPAVEWDIEQAPEKWAQAFHRAENFSAREAGIAF